MVFSGVRYMRTPTCKSKPMRRFVIHITPEADGIFWRSLYANTDNTHIPSASLCFAQGKLTRLYYILTPTCQSEPMRRPIIHITPEADGIIWRSLYANTDNTHIVHLFFFIFPIFECCFYFFFLFIH